MDQQALLYLVNKPCSIGIIARWFVILLDFDFTITVKKGSTHTRVDQVSHLTNRELPIGVNDNLPDVALFQIAYRCTYKTKIGTTPFNLVYGLDKILTIEFLVLLLRVAHTLEWIGHELLHRVDELE